jgi:transposase
MDGLRLVLTDRQWSLIAPHLPGKAGDRGVTARDNRLFGGGAVDRADLLALA